MSTRNITSLACGLMSLAMMTGCAIKTHLTPPARTVTEQLLLDQSLAHSLANATLPLPPGRTVALDVVGLTPDKDFVHAGVVRWLAQQGLSVPKSLGETYVLRVMIHAFGTNLDESFAGMPPIQGGLFPIATPELALFKTENQNALTRLSMDLYERSSGRLLMTTPMYEGYAYMKDSTLLFGIPHYTTNLNPGVIK